MQAIGPSLSLPPLDRASMQAALEAFPHGHTPFDDHWSGPDGDSHEKPPKKRKTDVAATATAQLLALLARHPALKELKLKGKPFDSRGYGDGPSNMLPEGYVTTVLDGLTAEQGLTSLELNGCVVAPATLSRCLPLLQLTRLDLSYSVVAGSVGEVQATTLLRVVGSLTTLTTLNLRDFANYYTNCDGTLPGFPCTTRTT